MGLEVLRTRAVGVRVEVGVAAIVVAGAVMLRASALAALALQATRLVDLWFLVESENRFAVCRGSAGPDERAQ